MVRESFASEVAGQEMKKKGDKGESFGGHQENFEPRGFVVKFDGVVACSFHFDRREEWEDGECFHRLTVNVGLPVGVVGLF